MSLQAREFFAALCLPFLDNTVVGNTYYATPVPGAPLRLRIDFTKTIHADTYGGLRLTVLHADRGEIDAVALSFIDHGTFHRRDEASNTPANSSRYGTFDKHHRPGQPPWEGAVTTRLRDAVEQYTAVWFPGAWTTPTPSRAAGRTAHQTPAPLTIHKGGRAR
ncbi:hypothetical protein DMH15_12365 [Streptomyces sp. WAC 06725]|uniref:hypothetical protein n=1 Tax=Streptomyces sp. WAC 06725 TaxID=2203209 RepID=UPI000F73E39A|nr:hypothetical protein [Streptomyces sp. WAC 06725]RSO42013.1 hypothetical protein DMH15_12365 [Streptomyces sp. WAC 06725]